MTIDQVLYTAHQGPVTQMDITKALVDAGLSQGDTVLLHSDVASFGKLGQVRDKDAFLKGVLDAFLAVIGPEGTLVVPTYTYSFCKGEVFDVRHTRSTTGSLSEYVRMQPGAIRSQDPIFSHAAIGPRAGEFLKDVGNDCFGDHSFFDRMYKAGGKIVNFGKFFDITFIHYIERKFGVDYRFDKSFAGTIVKEDGRAIEKQVTFYVRQLPHEGRHVEYEMPQLGNELERRGLLKKVLLGNSFILCSGVRDCFTVGLAMLKDNPYSFLTQNPHELVLKDPLVYTGLSDQALADPTRLPFVLVFDKQKRIIVQKYSLTTEKFLAQTYTKGSLISTNLGHGAIGIKRADDVLKYVHQALSGDVSGKTFLELGCADGYLLHRLKQDGAKDVLGCEPGPVAIEGSKRYGIKIINDFYRKDSTGQAFDMVFSYGVLEHIQDPASFLELQRAALKPRGIVFVAVPNCEVKLRLGDIGVLEHEHWNYFTRNSLNALLHRCGFEDLRLEIGMNNAMIYAWGQKGDSVRPSVVDQEVADEQGLFYGFSAKVVQNKEILLARLSALEAKGKTLGIYGGHLGMLLPLGCHPRFFDGDEAKFGKFHSGASRPIEPPRHLLSDPVDELWIAAIDYNDEIVAYLKDGLKISQAVEIVSIRDLINE